METYQLSEWCHHFIGIQVKEGDICIDATAGNGYDTEVLCQLVGAKGKVYAFDIQEQAIVSTRQRLIKSELENRATIILGGHENMKQYLPLEVHGQISCITFNFGYLPGGDRTMATGVDTSIAALEQGLDLLKKKGMMNLCIYSGGDSGFVEKERILSWLKGLDAKKYLVILTEYYNRPNHPPMPALVVRLT